MVVRDFKIINVKGPRNRQQQVRNGSRWDHRHRARLNMISLCLVPVRGSSAAWHHSDSRLMISWSVVWLMYGGVLMGWVSGVTSIVLVTNSRQSQFSTLTIEAEYVCGIGNFSLYFLQCPPLRPLTGVDGCIVLHCPGHWCPVCKGFESVSDNVLRCGRGVIKVCGSGMNKISRTLRLRGSSSISRKPLQIQCWWYFTLISLILHIGWCCYFW